MTKYNLQVEPYEYQAEGISQGLKWKRLLIGDEPGLGKTLQSIGIVNQAEAFPCLVICPSSLKINWAREWEKFTGRRAVVLSDNILKSWAYHMKMGMFDIAIVNYESLKKFFVYDIRYKSKRDKSFMLKNVVFNPAIKLFKSVIIDECHRVKDDTTQQAKLTKGITLGKEYIIMLSGTPVVNKPSDLIAQLAIMERLGEFGGKGGFIARYDEGHNLQELKDELYKRCLIRREKSKVLTQLPDKTRCDLVVSISNRDEYDLAFDDLKKYLKEYTECTDADIRRKMRMAALVRFMTLRSLSAKGKVKQALDFIRDFKNDKLIVFCSLHDIVDRLCEEIPGAVRITGRDSMRDKQNAIDTFQNDPNCKVIICSIKAAGVGITLTASSKVCFIEFPWTYSDCCQCEDRAHRIGQKENVTCYYLIGENTIDARLYKIIQDKRSTANKILGGNDEIPEDEVYFNELVNEIEGYEKSCIG